MKKEEKGKIIDQIQDAIAKSSIGIVTEYRGLTTPDLIELRKKLKEAGAKYEIVKNTLARRAAEKAGMSQTAEMFDGPVAMAYASGDATGLARAIADYIRLTPKTPLTIKGGFLGGKVITTVDVAVLTTLPSREVLIARVLGGFQAPISRLVSQLNAPIQGLVGVLQARANQLEEKGV